MKTKRAISVLLGLACLLSLVACSSNDTETTTETTPTTTTETTTTEAKSDLELAIDAVLVQEEPVSISFWTGTGTANYPYLEAMVAAFEAEYDNITVDFSNQGPVTELTEKLTQNIVSKSTPTLSNINTATYPEYIASGAIIDLAPFYNDESIGFTAQEQDDFFVAYIEEVKSLGDEGSMYGFPTNKKTTDVLVYNKTYFDAKGWDAPTSWDEVVAYSKIIFEETGSAGFSYDTSYGDAAFKTMSTQWGSDYLLADGTVDINNEASLAVLNFYKENMDAGYFTLPALMPSAGGNNSSNGFVMEECYMFIGAAAGIPYALPNPESGHEDFEVGVAPIPQYDTSSPAAYSKGENYAIFSNATLEEQVAAWLLVKYLSGDETNVEWLVSTGNLPISSSQQENTAYQTFLTQTSDAGTSYYMAQAVLSALDMTDFMLFDIAFDRSADLASEVGSMWLAVMIGGAEAQSSLEATAALFN